MHNILTRLKAQPNTYPKLDLSYSSSEPVIQPVVLTLPSNGIRMRFDGPDQRLRLIEILDFTKAAPSYKNTELVRRFKSSNDGTVEQEQPQSGPTFRHVYNRLFGPSYPGEYVPPSPTDDLGLGTYVLSYPGVAFSFPLQHSKWVSNADFVTLLSSSAAMPATSMAIFHGSSWSEARSDLFTRQPQLPRSISMTGRSKDLVADEIEEVRICGAGRLEFMQRTSPVFVVYLSKTTPQDLVAELGPPDAIYRKSDSKIAIHGEQAISEVDNASANLQTVLRGSNGIGNTNPPESGGQVGVDVSDSSSMPFECFYNYFHHGFDALISYPTETSPPFPDLPAATDNREAGSTSDLVVTKILLHGNVPGSYPFNRHRRSRWIIDTGGPEYEILNSEMPFDDLSGALKKVWRHSYASAEEEKSLQRGMVLNRGWGESPESSLELLGGWEESAGTRLPNPESSSLTDGVHGLGNTELFGFPGMLFEVLKNGTVSCLTVY